jgi:hypothetical protein
MKVSHAYIIRVQGLEAPFSISQLIKCAPAFILPCHCPLPPPPQSSHYGENMKWVLLQCKCFPSQTHVVFLSCHGSGTRNFRLKPPKPSLRDMMIIKRQNRKRKVTQETSSIVAVSVSDLLPASLLRALRLFRPFLRGLECGPCYLSG